jgi:uncharacterized iron-regulated protein
MIKLTFRSGFATVMIAFAAAPAVGAQQPLPAAAASGATAGAAPTSHPAITTTVLSYVPHRVFDTRRNQFVDFEAMLADGARSEVIFLGEQHDDPITHVLEAAALEGIGRRRGNVILAMEMFERDAQRPLSDYLAGTLAEGEFLAASRPWPRYATDYRPMVEYAKRQGWPVIAGNVPRRLASAVARVGLSLFDTTSVGDRMLAALRFDCPKDKYHDRFSDTMGDMSGHGPTAPKTPAERDAMVERMYQSQCVKDETMGEAIASALLNAPVGALVVHVNGAFHSDYRMGTAERARQRLDGKRVTVVSFVPVSNLDTVDGGKLRDLGDYVVFTLAPTQGK